MCTWAYGGVWRKEIGELFSKGEVLEINVPQLTELGKLSWP